MPDAKKNEMIAPKKLMLLVTVVKKGKGTFFADYLKNFDVNMQVSVVATGTAESNLVEFLGLKENKRSVVFSIVREDRLKQIFEGLEERFYTVDEGSGIAFAVPLSSVIGKLSYGFLSNDQRMIQESKLNERKV